MYALVWRMLAAEEAPKTTESSPSRPQTHSIASFAGMAPDAKMDIAMALQRRAFRRSR